MVLYQQRVASMLWKLLDNSNVSGHLCFFEFARLGLGNVWGTFPKQWGLEFSPLRDFLPYI